MLWGRERTHHLWKRLIASQPVVHKLFICSHGQMSAAAQSKLGLWNSDSMADTKGRGSTPWRVGELVATPNGFIAEIASLKNDRALIRYLTSPPGPGETELPLDLLRPATARDLVLARIAR